MKGAADVGHEPFQAAGRGDRDEPMPGIFEQLDLQPGTDPQGGDREAGIVKQRAQVPNPAMACHTRRHAMQRRPAIADQVEADVPPRRGQISAKNQRSPSRFGKASLPTKTSLPGLRRQPAGGGRGRAGIGAANTVCAGQSFCSSAASSCWLAAMQRAPPSQAISSAHGKMPRLHAVSGADQRAVAAVEHVMRDDHAVDAVQFRRGQRGGTEQRVDQHGVGFQAGDIASPPSALRPGCRSGRAPHRRHGCRLRTQRASAGPASRAKRRGPESRPGRGRRAGANGRPDGDLRADHRGDAITLRRPRQPRAEQQHGDLMAQPLQPGNDRMIGRQMAGGTGTRQLIGEEDIAHEARPACRTDVLVFFLAGTEKPPLFEKAAQKFCWPWAGGGETSHGPA